MILPTDLLEADPGILAARGGYVGSVPAAETGRVSAVVRGALLQRGFDGGAAVRSHDKFRR